MLFEDIFWVFRVGAVVVFGVAAFAVAAVAVAVAAFGLARGRGGRDCGGRGRGIWGRGSRSCGGGCGIRGSKGLHPSLGYYAPSGLGRVGRKGWTLYLSITYLRVCEGLHPSLGYYALSGLVGSGLVDRAVVCLWVLRSVGATCHKP